MDQRREHIRKRPFLGRMHGRAVALALLLLVCLWALSGCAGSGAARGTVQEKSAETERSLSIGFSFDSFVIERWTRDRDVFVSTAEELGATVNVQNANGDVEQQISQIEYFIDKKVDVIVIIAIDGDALADVVKRARDAGILVVCYDRLIRNADCDLYISFDNEMVGTLMGEALRAALPDGGKLIAVYGSPSDNNVFQVIEGFEKAIEGSGLEVVWSGYCDNWLAEMAFDIVSEGLSKYHEVDGVMCGNDDLAGQAVRALTENRLAGKAVVVAQDAELSACQRIVEGTQEMTVFKPVDELAREAAVLSVKLGGGQVPDGEAPEVTETIFDGSGDVPYFRIQPVAVTRDNLDEIIIGSGFHRREDVYLNIE